ncbi:CHAT domain-containing protein [Hassallia byssoidea VB512170]|uniref:CHAT domain-containing protein n=1 Tax=Hassallia byssoidea VB512170 TaxID=1304833 RepID=A0A846HH59_9CYAN|nr:tetratricopeptide repeat protein [Hassalia byssoidea]NEU76423.1 CHAT domain-containing protein [Hassalia byssoidea VB512170]
MRFHNLGLSAFVCLLVVFSNSWVPNLSMVFTASQVLAQTVNPRKASADRLLQQGLQQYQTSQFTAALQSWQQALKIYREIKDRQSEGNALGNLGVAYDSLGDYPKAIEYQQQRLAIAREIKDRQGEGQSLGNLGNAYHSLRDYPKAIEYQQQHLAIAREIKDRKSEGKALGNLGLAYYDLGNYPKAIEYQKQHLAIAREIKDRGSEGAALGNLGLAYYSLGDYPKAIEYLQQILAIAREIKDRQSEGNALGNLGIAYHSLGDYPKAIEYQQQILAIAREIKDRQGEGAALGNLGVAYDSLGDYPKAIEYQQQRLAIAREIKDRQGEGQSLGNLGLAYLSLGDYPKAIEYQQQRLAIAREIKDRQGEGQSLGNLGSAYLSLGDYPKAIEYHQKFLAIAREIKDRKSEGQSLGNLGIAYDSLGDYPKAIEYQQQRLAIAREIKDRQSEGISLNNLGYAFYKSGNLFAAEKTLYEAIKVYESLRGRELKDSEKVSFFDTQRNTYSTLQLVLIAQKKTDPALEIAERGRARAFVELISSRLANGNTEAKSPKPPTIAEMKQIAKAQNATLVQYSIVYDEFKVAGIEETDKGTRGLGDKERGVRQDGVRSMAKSQVQESELYIWVIKPTGEVTFRKFDLKPLWQQQNTSLETVVDSIRKTSPVEWNKPLKQLHQILIKPIASELPKDDSDRVIFIPQQSLFRVPFPGLQDDKGKYLIEQHTILTAPSIQVLQLTRQQRKLASGKDFLIVGNPTMPSVSTKIGEPPTQLDPLPEAEKEATEIANLFKTKAIIGKDATKVNIVQQMSKARIIHLATHGQVDDNQALGSWIALAPSGKDNGLLTAAEIFDLKLNAELLVLSACETGRGRLTGDGVVGLSRSLIYAGVPSVIVSLWTVPDDSTKLLMTEFYKNLQHNPDKAQALRQAMLMLKTSQEYSRPLQWAAFTLIGEAE